MRSLRHSLPNHRLQIPKRPRALPLSPPQPPPERPLRWVTTYTFSGNGSQQTIPFRIGDSWRLVWNSDPTAVQGLVCVAVSTLDRPDERGGTRGMQALCEPKTTYSVYEIHGGGQVCLHIISAGAWIARVQERKAA